MPTQITIHNAVLQEFETIFCSKIIPIGVKKIKKFSKKNWKTLKNFIQNLNKKISTNFKRNPKDGHIHFSYDPKRKIGYVKCDIGMLHTYMSIGNKIGWIYYLTMHNYVGWYIIFTNNIHWLESWLKFLNIQRILVILCIYFNT